MSDVLDKSKFKFFNDKEFYITLIDDNDFDLNELDWNNPNYVQMLTSYSFIRTVLVDSTNFLIILVNILKLMKTILLLQILLVKNHYILIK